MEQNYKKKLCQNIANTFFFSPFNNIIVYMTPSSIESKPELGCKVVKRVKLVNI